ncbi:MAG: TetR/AcrR family transcriptional regulator [Polyangiaceae bacterium]|nr:TetR/AcrR family transcriptional regulator [Polyangiaceae bacterium]
MVLFARKGFDGVRVKEVAKASGISVPLLCHHFQDKETLYQTVLELALLRVASLGNVLVSQTRTISDRLELVLSGMLEILATDSQEIAVLHRELIEGGARLRTKSKELLLPIKQKLIEEIRAAQASGEIRGDFDADFLLLHLVGAIIYPTIAVPILGILWSEATHASDWRSRRKQELLALLPLLLRPPVRGGPSRVTSPSVRDEEHA